jgi:hypothetical protein
MPRAFPWTGVRGGAKTNRIDLELLIRMLLALERGETRIEGTPPSQTVSSRDPAHSDSFSDLRGRGADGTTSTARRPHFKYSSERATLVIK